MKNISVEKVVDRFVLEDLLEEELGRDESEEFMDWVWENYTGNKHNDMLMGNPMEGNPTPWDDQFEDISEFFEGEKEPPLDTPLRRAYWWVEKNLPQGFRIHYYW